METATAAAPSPIATVKPQGHRFRKSGSTSPISRAAPPVVGNYLSRSPSLPLLIPTTSASSSSIANSAVDPKLYQIVRKITASTPSLLISGNSHTKTAQLSRKNAVQSLVEIVLERHREYRRKDTEWVKCGVEGALRELAAAENNDAGRDVGRKRRRVPVGGGSEADADAGDAESSVKRIKKEAVHHKEFHRSTSLDAGIAVENLAFLRDVPSVESYGNISNHSTDYSSGNTTIGSEYPNIATVTKPTGGMLNASLRNRYKDVQREREAVAASVSCGPDSSCAAVAQSSCSNNGHDDAATITPRKEHEAESKTENNDLSVNTNHASCTPAPKSSSSSAGATPSKKKKKLKKTPSKSQPNQSFHNEPATSNQTSLLLPSPRPTERYSTLGGLSPLLTTIRHLIEYPLSHPELFSHLGIDPPRGVLLRGPPGCGKTHLAKAIAGELNVSYFGVSAPELVGGVSGESEGRVRTLFESAAYYAPSIVFIDEIDAIAPKRGEGGGGGGKSMEKRIVAQLLTSMDGMAPDKTRGGGAVIVMGATNRPDALDPALRRAGRFDREIVLGAPDEAAREGILRVMTSQMRLDGELDHRLLAKKTPGFVGADIRSLTKEAAVIAINRIFRLLNDCDGGSKEIQAESLNSRDAASAAGDSTENDTGDSAKVTAPQTVSNDDTPSNDIRTITPLTAQQLEPLYITMDDFLAAIPHVQPSSKREGFATVPDVSWSDIGALADIREELTLSVLEPIAHPEKFEALGLPLPAGVLLYGPPGCGKTLLAKAIANESGANFISVKGPELLDKYVGESERSVRVVFERARTSSPCIIFFDELDSLCPKRGSDGGGGGGVSERVVNQLLTEMDGLDSRRSVFVIAATNRPELIDPAMLRPGRLDKLLYVPLPSPNDRLSILRALSKKIKLAPDVDLESVAFDPHANGFSGADCAALLREAGLAVLRDGVLNCTAVDSNADTTLDENEAPPLQITAQHFKYAFDHVLPSVSKKDQARYDRLRARMARARTRSVGENGTSNIEEREGGGDVSDVPPESTAVE
ncbi:hypothetical protein ACHAW6_011945 [Cyclotella cf. meneghiniana]